LTGSGSLAIVGTGIRFAAQTTPEALAAIERADVVLYLGGESVADEWIAGLNEHTESLAPLYTDRMERGDRRTDAYRAMADHVLERVREGHKVCLALYGHPMLFATPAVLAARDAEAEGFPVRVLPGVSAEDCLLADLRFDPGTTGRLSYEATHFLRDGLAVEPTAALVLWQIGAVGNDHAVTGAPDPAAVARLTERLLATYPEDHEVVLYRASEYVIFEPRIDRLRLADLPSAEIDPMATLFVPPLG
jgi:uncharacterized protein YabN with tetrapyrrole methylase and pyrophosphatase domain